MSLQSRFVGCGEGESGERLSCGDTLPLVKRTADAKLERTSLSTGGLQGHPSESFSPPSPGQVVDGTEDSGKVLPRPPASGADCLFRQVRREVLSRPLCSREPLTLRRYFGLDSEIV